MMFRLRTALGQKCPKQLRLPAGKSTHEHTGRIVPGADINRCARPPDVLRRCVRVPRRGQSIKPCGLIDEVVRSKAHDLPPAK